MSGTPDHCSGDHCLNVQCAHCQTQQKKKEETIQQVVLGRCTDRIGKRVIHWWSSELPGIPNHCSGALSEQAMRTQLGIALATECTMQKAEMKWASMQQVVLSRCTDWIGKRVIHYRSVRHTRSLQWWSLFEYAVCTLPDKTKTKESRNSGDHCLNKQSTTHR